MKMKQAEDTKTAELPGLSRRGRPPAGERAMTPAERQRAYRQRKADLRWVPNNAIKELPRVDLMARLATALAAADKAGQGTDEWEGATYHAEEILAEIATRYELDAYRINRKAKASRVTK